MDSALLLVVFFFNLIFTLCALVFCVYVFLCESVGSPGTGEGYHVCIGNRTPGPVEEQPVLQPLGHLSRPWTRLTYFSYSLKEASCGTAHHLWMSSEGSPVFIITIVFLGSQVTCSYVERFIVFGEDLLK